MNIEKNLIKLEMEDVTKNTIVKKDNSLLDGKYTLTLHQAQFISFMVSLIKIEDSSFQEYEINLSNLLSIMKVERKNWKQLSKTLTQLLQKIVIITDNENEIFKTTILSSFRIINSKDIVSFGFHHSMRPLLLQLKSKFTQIKLEEIFNFKSVYTIKFYEILKRELDKHNYLKKVYLPTFKYELEELKEIMVGDYNLKEDKIVYPKTYINYNDFKKRILLVAQKELRTKSSHYFEFEEKKTKRKVTNLIFTIHKKKKDRINELHTDIDVLESLKTYKDYMDMPFENRHFNLIKEIRANKNKVFFRPYLMNKINVASNYYPHVTYGLNSKNLIINRFSKEVLDKYDVNAVICFLADHKEFLYDLQPKIEEYIGFYFDIKITAKNILGYYNDEVQNFTIKQVKTNEDNTIVIQFVSESQYINLKFKDINSFLKKINNMQVRIEDLRPLNS